MPDFRVHSANMLSKSIPRLGYTATKGARISGMVFNMYCFNMSCNVRFAPGFFPTHWTHPSLALFYLIHHWCNFGLQIIYKNENILNFLLWKGMSSTDVYSERILCLDKGVTKITFITRVICYMLSLNMPPNVCSIFHFFSTLRANPAFALWLIHHRWNMILQTFREA